MNFIDQQLQDYCEKYSSPEEEILFDISRQTHLTQINPRMLSGNIQGAFLKMITRLHNPENILEIGTFTGYSAICMAMGMSSQGKLHTIEIDEELKDMITGNFEKAGFGNKIILHTGNALDIIPELIKSVNFDLVFMDADKQNYPAYFSLLKGSLRKGSVLIADNVLWGGKVIHANERANDADTDAIHRFNCLLNADDSFEKVILPIRDGITIATKIS